MRWDCFCPKVLNLVSRQGALNSSNMTLTLEGPGLTLALVSIILLILSWVTVVGRLIVRRTIKAVGSDDWFMVAGLILYTLACQATISAAYNGVGARAERLNEFYDRQGRKWFMFFQLFYVASTVPIKCSICVALLRITTAKRYIWSLYAIMFLSCIAALTTDIAVLAWCKPISATWDKRTGSCADASIITNVSYFISTISIITDFSCAILPVFILSSVQLRFRIKASVAIILALGVVASTATLVRLRYLFSYNKPTDYLYNIANIAIWSIVESGIGLIAGSLPALRPLLRYVPFLGGESDAGSSDRTRSRALSGALTFRRSRHKLDTPHTGAEAAGSTTCEAGKRSWLELSDAESQKYILKESHVAVTNVAVADIEASDKRASRQDTTGHFDRSRFDD